MFRNCKTFGSPHILSPAGYIFCFLFLIFVFQVGAWSPQEYLWRYSTHCSVKTTNTFCGLNWLYAYCLYSQTSLAIICNFKVAILAKDSFLAPATQSLLSGRLWKNWFGGKFIFKCTIVTHRWWYILWINIESWHKLIELLLLSLINLDYFMCKCIVIKVVWN